jgi:hypothetical protein
MSDKIEPYDQITGVIAHEPADKTCFDAQLWDATACAISSWRRQGLVFAPLDFVALGAREMHWVSLFLWGTASANQHEFICRRHVE